MAWRNSGAARRVTAVSSRRLTGVIALFVLAGAVSAALMLARIYHLGVAGTGVAILIGLPSLFVAWMSFSASQHAPADATIGQGSLAAAADELAKAVRDQWFEEAAAHNLDNPGLPVRLVPAAPPLAEEWAALTDLATSGAGWPPPQDTTWAPDNEVLACDGSAVACLLAQIPTRRLVVLGEPGAGKTMLLIRLVLDLLASRKLARPAQGERADPVPMLISLAGWNPAEDGLREWIAAQMILDHPALAQSAPSGGTGRTLAMALLAEALITPVLDGLDEVSDGLRGAAIAQLNQALRPGEAAVVSSRRAAYETAVCPEQGAVVRLRGAAVVKLCPVEADTARQYLLQDAANPAGWVKALSTNEHARQALTTPLMLGLAREIYNPSHGECAEDLPDPAELCGPAMNSREAVERHLLEAFVPAAYRPLVGSSRRSRWPGGKAQRYLSFLAGHLEHQPHGTTDLAWWALCGSDATPAKGLRWSPESFQSKLMLTPAVGLVVVTAYVLAGKLALGFGGGLASAFACCLAAGLRSAPANLTVAASPGMILARDRSTFLAWGLLAGPLIGLAVGLIMGLATPSRALSSGPQIGLVTGLVVGPIAWLVCTLVFNWVTGLVFGLVIGTADWLVSWLLGQLLHTELAIQVISGSVMGVVVGLLFGLVKTTWPMFVLARCRFAIRGHLPWRLMRFLADAHRRGVLRQAGAVYRFRHAELQRCLAADQGRAALRMQGNVPALSAASSGDPEPSG